MNPQDKAFMTVFSSVLAVLVAIAVVIFIVAQLISGVSAPEYDRSESLRAEAARRLEPVGRVVLAGSAAAEAQQTAAAGPGDAAQSGEQVYNSVCSACHNAGVLNSPKLGDAAAWEERYQKGLDQLVANAINGYNQMPARGGNAALSDAEVRASVVYLLRESGIEVADAGTEQVASAEETAPADGEAQTAADTSAEQATAEEPAADDTQATTDVGSESAPENGQPATAAEAAGDTAQSSDATGVAIPAGFDPAAGESTYNTVCMVCHAQGVAGAPKLGDTAAWETRLAQGWDTLADHTLNGFKGMPPKGGRPDIDDQQILEALAYMVQQARLN